MRKGSGCKKVTYKYIGEHSAEHMSAAARVNIKNFIVKHWVLKHSDFPEQPG